MRNSATDPVIVCACRTAVGTLGGALKTVAAPALGKTVLTAALEQSTARPGDIGEVIFGNVLQAGSGPNPARIAAVQAGIPYSVPAMTVNKVCGSGLKAVALAAQAVRAGDGDLILAGGMESMSSAPYVLPAARWGARMGHGECLDSMILNGLWDCFYDCHMGVTAENLAEEYGISRGEQDRYALETQKRCEEAVRSGRFEDEIVPVAVPQRKGDPVVFERDEHPRPGLTLADLERLRPAFKPDGTVTAGNASGINDGAAAVLVASRRIAEERGWNGMAVVRGVATVGVDPRIMGIGPAGAIAKLLRRCDLTLDDIDLLEVNEAFAAQTLAVKKELGWDAARVNVNGGAIALGHPIGASGARILVTLLHEMAKREVRLGIAGLCIGGGMGIAMLVERP